MTACPPPRGTDRAFERLARVTDPAATLDDPPDETAELPELPAEPLPRHRHRAPARLRDRAAYGVTGVALAGAVILAAVMAAGGGVDGRPGVTPVPSPTVGEPEAGPSTARPPRAVPPPATARARRPKRTPSASPTPIPARTVTVTPSPARVDSPARSEPSPAPTVTQTSTAPDPPPPPPPPPCAEGQEPPACTPTTKDDE